MRRGPVLDQVDDALGLGGEVRQPRQAADGLQRGRGRLVRRAGPARAAVPRPSWPAEGTGGGCARGGRARQAGFTTLDSLSRQGLVQVQDRRSPPRRRPRARPRRASRRAASRRRLSSFSAAAWSAVLLPQALERGDQDVALSRRRVAGRREPEGEPTPFGGRVAALRHHPLGQDAGGLDVGHVVERRQGVQRRVGPRRPDHADLPGRRCRRTRSAPTIRRQNVYRLRRYRSSPLSCW